MEWLPIETERLVLRRFGVGDLAAFQSYRQDAELSRYQGWQPVPDAEALRFLREQEQARLGARGTWLQVALTRRHDGELIGDLGLCMRDERLAVIELGFTLARRAHKRGFASEAVSAVLATLFGQKLARSAIAVTDSSRPASSASARITSTTKKVLPSVSRCKKVNSSGRWPARPNIATLNADSSPAASLGNGSAVISGSRCGKSARSSWR